MSNEIDNIEKQLTKGRDYNTPPLHLWHPELSGDIDIRIAADGKWFHEGDEIVRDSIVRLFASILRREDDDEYYLVTPGEKWRIQVDLLPLMVTDVCWDNPSEHAKKRVLQVTLNTGKNVLVDDKHPLFLESAKDNIAAVSLAHGLAALFSRNAWYRLVDMSEQDHDRTVVVSAGQRYILG